MTGRKGLLEMSLEIGKAYDYEGWIFVPVSLKWPVFQCLTLDTSPLPYREYGKVGQLSEVFANSVVGQTAVEFK